MNYEFRKLNADDSKGYRKIRLEALKKYPRFYGSNYSDQIKLPKLFFERLLEEDSGKGMMIGAFTGDELIGICGIIFDDMMYPEFGEIVQFYVNEAHQNRGLGKKLLEETIEQSKDTGIIRVNLEVQKNNAPAIKLYEKLGFKLDRDKDKISSKGLQFMMLSV